MKQAERNRKKLGGILGVLCLGLVLGPVSLPTSAQDSELIVFTHATVIPLDREVQLEDMHVFIRGEKIVAMGKAEDLAVPGEATVINARGQYLLPGLTDMHVHLREESWLKLFLANGVTTVRNMNGKPEFIQWREQIKRSERLGPTIFTASPFTSRDRNPAFVHLPSPEAARDAVRRFAAEGYDLVKVVTLDKDTFFALMDEAGKHNLPVAGHNPSILVDLYAGYPVENLDFSRALALEEVLCSGMVSLEHLNELFAVGFARLPLEEKLPAFAQQVRNCGVAVTTLLIREAINNELLTSPDTFLTPQRLEAIRHYWSEEFVERARRTVENHKNLDDPTRRMRLQNLPFILKLLKALQENGATVLAGTDSGGLFAHSGLALHDELDLFIQAGLSPYETLRAATYNPARVLNLLDHAGSVAVGKTADLILVSGNPLQDIQTLRTPVGVMTRGRWLDRDTLEEFGRGN